MTGRNGYLNSMVCRLILDAGFRHEFSSNPLEVARKATHDDVAAGELSGLDVGGIRLFSAFVTKVQHNHTWRFLPEFRSALKRSGLEFELFCEFESDHMAARRSGDQSPRLKLVRFVEFAKTFLLTKGYKGLFLRTLLEREFAVHAAVEEHMVRRPLSDEVLGVALANGDACSVKRNGYVAQEWRVTWDELSGAGVVWEDGIHDFNDADVPCAWSFYCLSEDAGRVERYEMDYLDAALVSSVDGIRAIGEVIDDASGELSRHVDDCNCDHLLETCATRVISMIQQGLLLVS